MTMKKFYFSLAMAAILPYFYGTASATMMSEFSTASNGWNNFTTGTNEDGNVNPGTGGQLFDAEYLFYKINGNILSIGLQAGFDLRDGNVLYDRWNYYAGDLALSFDGTTTVYEYAVDFGLLTKDYYQHFVDADLTGSDGRDSEGFYKNITWNNNVYSGYTGSAPFAMDGGQIVDGALISNSSSSENYSYYRIVELDLSKILGSDWNTNDFTLSAHWTMSCGNDEIDGTVTIPAAPVPEPATMLLFGTGLVGLAGLTRRRVNR